MGSCVSLSHSPPASSAPGNGPVAKIVDIDGSMTRLEVPVTARDALLASGGRASSQCFLCSSDELGFDAPVRALAAEEALHPRQLYFVLPASMLRRPLSGQDMAALAVRATRALAVEAGLVATAGVSSTWRHKGGDGRAGKMRSTARVAPLLAQSGKETSRSFQGAPKHHGYEHDGEMTPRKTRRRVRGARRPRPGVQRLSAIAEDSSE